MLQQCNLENFDNIPWLWLMEHCKTDVICIFAKHLLGIVIQKAAFSADDYHKSDCCCLIEPTRIITEWMMVERKFALFAISRISINESFLVPRSRNCNKLISKVFFPDVVENIFVYICQAEKNKKDKLTTGVLWWWQLRLRRQYASKKQVHINFALINSSRMQTASP